MSEVRIGPKSWELILRMERVAIAHYIADSCLPANTERSHILDALRHEREAIRNEIAKRMQRNEPNARVVPLRAAKGS
jgi:hypothetical protein